MHYPRKSADLFRRILCAFRPPPDISVSEWAETYRYIPEGAAEPGRWRNSRTPHLVGIMDALSDSSVSTVVAMLASQTGKSEFLLNTIGRYAHVSPAPILMLRPTQDDARTFSKERIAPMISATPELKDRFGSPKTRDGDNTILNKKFPGGFLSIVGSNAPSGLASRPIKLLLADEVDRYEASAGTEGDPISLAEKRLTTFWDRKMALVSSPGDAETSRIEPAYKTTTMERWNLPCPKCGEYQPLEWSGLIYKDLSAPVYRCRVCVETSEEYEWKGGTGRWIAEFPERKDRGFHASSLISFFIDWPELVKEWLFASSESKKGNNEPLKVFINTRLGETWTQPGQQVEEDEVTKRKEPYVYRKPDGSYIPCEVPDGVLLLTAGVDVQDNRFEVEVVGWGPEWESWGIEYRVIMGNPSTQEAWDALDEYLLRRWRYGDGTELGIAGAAIDSGDGGHTSDVYRFTKPRESRHIFAIKGQGGVGVPMVARATQNTRNRATLFVLGVDEIKGKILSDLKRTEPGAGYCHFPLSADLDDAHRRGYTDTYFKRLVSERRVFKYNKGYKKYEWIKESGVRNEPIDCRAYARGIVAIINPNFYRLQKLREKQRGMRGANAPITVAPVAKRKKKSRGSKGISI